MGSSSRKTLDHERLSVRFEGHVQGVGFRFTTARIATDFDITGYVKNEFDGDVTLLVEGEHDQLIRFLKVIRQSPIGRYIVKEHVAWHQATGEFNTFGVKY